MAHDNLAEAYWLRGETVTAGERYRKVLALLPSDSELEEAESARIQFFARTRLEMLLRNP